MPIIAAAEGLSRAKQQGANGANGLVWRVLGDPQNLAKLENLGSPRIHVDSLVGLTQAVGAHILEVSVSHRLQRRLGVAAICLSVLAGGHTLRSQSSARAREAPQGRSAAQATAVVRRYFREVGVARYALSPTGSSQLTVPS